MNWLFSSNSVVGRLFSWGRDESGPEGEPDLLVVRRGLSPAFYFFCQLFAKENQLVVVPDRRQKSRRRRQRPCPTTDRRQSYDRRGAGPIEVQRQDFWVVRRKRPMDGALDVSVFQPASSASGSRVEMPGPYSRQFSREPGE